MRIKSFRRERYPFCARRFLRKIKENEREIDGSLDRSLLFWFAFEPQWVYAVPVLVAIEFHVRSLSSSLSAHRSCSLRNKIRFASKAMEFL